MGVRNNDFEGGRDLLRLTTAPDGSLWAWSRALYFLPRQSMPGLVHIREGRAEYHPRLPGLPEHARFTLVHPSPDGRELWCGTLEHGWHVLNLQQPSARPMPLPAAEARAVVAWWPAFEAEWLLTLIPPPEGGPFSGETRLWRRTSAQDAWKPLGPPFRASHLRTRFLENGICAHGGHLWIRGDSRGLLRVRANGKKTDWIGLAQGLPFPQPEGVFSLDTNRLGLLAFNGMASLDTSDWNAPELPSAGWRHWPEIRSLLHGPQLTLYALHRSGSRAVHWENGRWNSLPDIPTPQDNGILPRQWAVDSLDRLWCFGRALEERAWVWNPESRTWDDGPLGLLLRRSFEQGPFHFPTHAHDGWPHPPVIDDRGRMAWHADGRLFLHDGQSWQTTDAATIGHAGDFRDLRDLGIFGETGEIWISVRQGEHFLWGHDGTWRKAPNGSIPWRGNPHRHADGIRTLEGRPLKGAALTRPDGRGWMLAEDTLWTVAGGLAAPVFPGDSFHPFVRPAHLNRFFHAKDGSVFFDLGMNNPLIVQLEPLPPFRASWSVVSKGKDAFEVQAASTILGGYYTFQVNGGAWEPWRPTQQSTPLFLSQGTHAIRTAFLDAHLNSQPLQETTLRVDYRSDKEATRQARALIGKNWNQRQDAIAFLERNPIEARLALEKLRQELKNPTPEDLWWLEAAEQAVERARARAAP